MSVERDKKDKSKTIKDMMKEEEGKGTQSGSTSTPATGKTNWQRILDAKSGTKTKEEYLKHPLNYDGKDSTGQIIKGSEGLAGSLDTAVIDIIVGLIRKGKEAWDAISEGKEKE